MKKRCVWMDMCVDEAVAIQSVKYMNGCEWMYSCRKTMAKRRVTEG